MIKKGKEGRYWKWSGERRRWEERKESKGENERYEGREIHA